MHIPDGFLSAPVWLGMDLAGAAAVTLLARQAGRHRDEARIPLLGVMGAFVFAAQMINFPVAAGASGHLLGAVLLAVTLGPAAACVVMTAILAIQALVFQDGGVLALGANVFNMAVAGVLAGYLPYALWGRGRWRSPAIVAGGILSVAASAALALGELKLSGVKIPGPALGAAAGLFLLNGIVEGAITLGVVRALERLDAAALRRPASRASAAWTALGLAALLLASGGALIASQSPDVLESLAERTGIAERARVLLHSPLADYEWPLGGHWAGKAAAGLAGLGMVYLAGRGIGKLVGRRRSG